MVWALLVGILGALHGLAQTQQSAGPEQAGERVKAAAQALAAEYDIQTGLFRGTGWWNSANGITALANASRQLPTRDFDSIFANTFRAAQHKNPGFLNEFYDDEGWWALAWLDVYDLRHDPRYLKMAESIFADMSGGWSDTCGGGIWWKKNEHYKNAIANELFLSVAVRLAQRSTAKARSGYLRWALKEERWFLASGMINSDSLVNDGLDSSCQNNHRETWTYNQGVLLTGLVGLHQLTADPAALGLAERISAAVDGHLTDKDGIFHDACEPNCGDDGVQFKGVLVRNLAMLARSSNLAGVARLINTNAESVWARARTSTDRFSVVWSGPPQDSGTGSLISALDALTAGLAVSTSDGSPRNGVK